MTDAPYVIHEGDCLAVLRDMPAASVDAVVTDPPYGLAFMGKRWDYAIPGADVWAECLRVLRPGGRLLAFASTRTMHRMWVNIEDAGFTIEDSICWLYGSGFPKHGSKLKPAYEPICVARKGPVTLLNVDACRIPYVSEVDCASAFPGGRLTSHGTGSLAGPGAAQDAARSAFDAERPTAGRWPANVAHDGSEEVMEAFAAFGEKRSYCTNPETAERASGKVFVNKERQVYGLAKANGESFTRGQMYADTGTVARFFYCAKASRSERDSGGVVSTHPTVKPVALMRWLCRLVTPPGGLVLDPFAGSGTTGVAALAEGFRFIGVEREAEYAAIARARCEAALPACDLFTAAPVP